MTWRTLHRAWPLLLPVAMACGDEGTTDEIPREYVDPSEAAAEPTPSEAPKPAPEPSAPPAEASAAAAAGEEEAQDVIAQVTLTDDDFVESESNRDPFRSYETSFQIKAPAAPQRLVLMPDVGIEQMKLIAIISGVDKPRAMLVDPGGVGHVAARGDFIGRAEVVQTGGRDSLPVTLNWRVDRIRSTEVVLAREDPSSPNRAPLTRVLPLYEDEQLAGTLKRSATGPKTLPQFGAKQGGD